jgi:putative DNA methylase
MPTKLIEVALPLDIINREAYRENFIYRGNPSAIHKWWAQRPLAACRAVLFAQLVDDPSAHPDRFPSEQSQDAERRRLFRILEQLVAWEATNDETILEEARAEIRKCYPDGPPAIADPFCGGGSIPLEAQRLGLDVRASDLNPVAVLITKALIELPPKFVDQPPVHPSGHGTLAGTQSWTGAAGLAEDVRWYGSWMRDEAETRIGHLYPKALLPDGSHATVIAWLWARTVTCPNPACRSTMPLVRSFWIGKKKGKETWVDPIPDPTHNGVRFEIGHGNEGPPIRDTVGRAGATCVVCRSPVPLEYVRGEGKAGRMGAQLMAVVAEGNRQRTYLPPDRAHESSADVGRPEDVPDTELPDQALGFRVQAYGMTHHADLFTNRQLTALCTFSDLVGEAHARVLIDSGGNRDYANAVATYLAFVNDKTAEYGCTIVPWYPKEDRPKGIFARQAVPMVWDYAEVNPLSTIGGSFFGSTKVVAEALEGVPRRAGTFVSTTCSDATVTTTTGAVSTDPPYYDNIGYADLADFFYIWLRRTLHDIYPELFGTMLSPKRGELVATPFRFNGDRTAADRHFEDGLAKVFARVVATEASGTPTAVFYAFKQSEASDDGMGTAFGVASTGWEKMLEGLLSSGLMVTGTWPMRTERASRSTSLGTNALASSIVLICRARAKAAGVTDRRGFQQALKARLAGDLRVLQSGGIAPVDLAQAAIGPGMAVFSRHAKVVEADGSSMSIRTALQLINRVLDEVTAEQEGEFDENTRWAIAWYAEHGMDDGPYGRADDLSRAKNVSVDGLVHAGIVKSGGGKVRLVDRTDLDSAWDPAIDARLTVWEVAQHLIRRLLDDGEASAADLLMRVGGLGDAARDLAYRLFQIAESKKWAKEAAPYNALAAAWPRLSRLAAAGPSGQGTML